MNEVTKRRINVGNGVFVESVPVSLQTTGENWNEYLAKDGTVIRCKLVVTQAFRVEGAYDQDGNPIYVLRSTTAMTADAPEELRRVNEGPPPQA